MNPVLVALDTPDLESARSLAKSVRPYVGGYKVGLELMMAAGPRSVAEIAQLGMPVFADAKLHDIPNTVKGAAGQIARQGARWITVHAAGGRAMLEAAIEGAASTGSADCGILAVTVLTSLDTADLEAAGLGSDITAISLSLARHAAESSAEGVVCSPNEVADIAAANLGLITVTPGIRPAGTSGHDQKRTATPESALQAGADLLVIGRAITAADDPAAAAARIAATLPAIS